MNDTCANPGLNRTVTPGAFPDPELDLQTTDAEEASVVLAGGCFWCVEAVFREVMGVVSCVSGYAGGSAEQANYRDVCSGATGHAEVVRVTYNPQVIRYGQILKIFFSVAHDPTQLNRQGNDRGTQYRSAIFWADEQQRDVAAAYIRQLDAAGVFSQNIETRLERLETFYEGEAYHQNYAAENPNQPYIAAVSTPKVDKLKKAYPWMLRSV